MTNAPLEQLHDRGFAAWPEFIDSPTVATIRDYYDKILTREIVIPGDRMLGSKIRQVMSPHATLDYFRENPAVERGKQVAREVFKQDEVWLFFDMLISKEPGNVNETPWHQDYSYSQMPVAAAGTAIDNHSLNFWVALDDVDEANGCMHFIPGLHKKPLLPHFVALGEPDDPGRLLATDAAPVDRAVPMHLPAGGASVHFEGTPHHAGGNHTTDRQRRAYIFIISKIASSP